MIPTYWKPLFRRVVLSFCDDDHVCSRQYGEDSLVRVIYEPNPIILSPNTSFFLQQATLWRLGQRAACRSERAVLIRKAVTGICRFATAKKAFKI